jgi:hypothetical protein
VLDLPLPGAHLKEARDASYHDLTAHPWAGLPVDIHLEATDALSQSGQSETLRITLPERVFHHPVARAVIEQRKQLTLDPSQREMVAETLSDLSLRPKLFNDDTVAFLALRTSRRRRSPRCSSCCGRPQCGSRTAAPRWSSATCAKR